MDAYFVRDKDPHGGNYAVWRTMPDDMSIERNTIQEVRKGDFPAETWMEINFGELKPDPINHYDEIFLPHYEAAEVVWTREGGYVNDGDTV